MTQKLYAEKLRPGAHVRVIAPSRSLSIVSQGVRDIATRRLESLGLRVTLSKRALESDEHASSSIASRLEDLHEAFADTDVDAIFTAIGGYNAIQLLHGINFELIKNNPKILCGFSDISVLSNALYAKTGVVGYCGPHYSSWGMEEGFEYSAEMVKHCLFGDAPYELIASKKWSDDPWFLDQHERTFNENPGPEAVNHGIARGTIIGGHVRCLAALQGTALRPSFDNAILFLEEDEEITGPLFDRLLYSLCHQLDFTRVRGIVIGRFQVNSKISPDDIRAIIKANRLLNHLPVITGVDIGHTTPLATIPIGGECEITADGRTASIRITKH